MTQQIPEAEPLDLELEVEALFGVVVAAFLSESSSFTRSLNSFAISTKATFFENEQETQNNLPPKRLHLDTLEIQIY